jgi:hypothetical protein
VSSKILTALFLVAGASALHAGAVYSCGGGSACNGNLYAVWVGSVNANGTYTLDVGIQVTAGYTGSTSDFINALAIIPDNNSSMTGATLTGKPAGIWNLQSGGLNAGGCSGDGTPVVCAGATGMGSNLFTYNSFTKTYDPKLLVWQFTITGPPPSLGDTAHIKYHYIDSLGNNVGSLGSFDVAIQCIGGGNCAGSGPTPTVPEPVTSALIGGGLVGLYFLRRRLPGSR